MKTQSIRDGVPLHLWLIEPLDREVAASLTRLARADDVAHIAVMPDVHLSGDVCVGTVLATNNLIYPTAVGGDIGCGMAAVALECGAELLARPGLGHSLLSDLSRTIPAIRHPRRRTAPAMPAQLADAPLSDPSLEAVRRRDGSVQFATLGRGNHFLEFQCDEDDRLWLMIHSGSRAMGTAIRDFHLSRAGNSARLIGIDTRGPAGKAYLHDANWARQYADASRLAMLEAVIDLMQTRYGVKPDWTSLIRCDHNHVARETHFGRELWVHRKGAARVADGDVGIIPGSMGTCSFHTIGRGNPQSLCSSSHGAGRAMSREMARRKLRATDLERRMRGVCFDATIAPALLEESPDAYKDIEAVMRAQRELTRIVRKLRPLLVCKAP